MIYDTHLRRITEVFRAENAIWEAPNWSRDGKFLVPNSGGRIYQLPVDGSTPPQPINLDAELRANNDHDYSPDGTRLAISASTSTSKGSQVFVANVLLHHVLDLDDSAGIGGKVAEQRAGGSEAADLIDTLGRFARLGVHRPSADRPDVRRVVCGQ